MGNRTGKIVTSVEYLAYAEADDNSEKAVEIRLTDGRVIEAAVTEQGRTVFMTTRYDYAARACRLDAMCKENAPDGFVFPVGPIVQVEKRPDAVIPQIVVFTQGYGMIVIFEKCVRFYGKSDKRYIELPCYFSPDGVREVEFFVAD